MINHVNIYKYFNRVEKRYIHCVCVCIYIYAFCVCVCVCVNMYIYVYVHCVQTCIVRTYIHMHTITCTHTQITHKRVINNK